MLWMGGGGEGERGTQDGGILVLKKIQHPITSSGLAVIFINTCLLRNYSLNQSTLFYTKSALPSGIVGLGVLVE